MAAEGQVRLGGADRGVARGYGPRKASCRWSGESACANTPAQRLHETFLLNATLAMNAAA
jgi:hypothetical protein